MKCIIVAITLDAEKKEFIAFLLFHFFFVSKTPNHSKSRNEKKAIKFNSSKRKS